MSLEEFQMISLVGRGAFGKVFLVYSPVNKKFYALKSMRKDIILDKNSLDSIDLERIIMLQVDHPFIVKMMMVFQNNLRVYFVLEYLPGGELF
jgi:protein-serine/threonine kinase